MKTIINTIAVFLLFTGTSLFAIAQENQAKEDKNTTAEFEVRGVCGMCEKRIETAALVDGVMYAEWDKHAQLLKVVYDNSQTDETAIQQAVANAGHDTKDIEAPKEAYDKIPGCCAYRDGVEVH